jgi:formylglycine-generating enzyme required for sulfatase activity
MVDYYFGHPAYHDYPVVGVSFDQAKAFCAWLTITLNNNPDYPKGLVADLPKPHQWFFAVNAEKKGFADLEQSYAGDQTFMADLLLKLPEGGNHMNELALNRVMNRQSKPTTYSHDGGFYTKPAYRNPKKETKENPLLIDEGPVMGLTDNVSEWIDFHYTEGYERILAQRQNYLRGSRNRANRFLADLEMYYDGHPGQALIYGANWFDERYSQLYGKNYAGAYAKAWSDPEMSYSTVGFRVVINYPVNQEVENN